MQEAIDFNEESRNFTTENLKTPNGKELAVFKVANTSLYRVAFTSGGQVPDELQGMWTDPSMAQRHIKSYISRKEREEQEVRDKEAANRLKNVKQPKQKAKQ